MPVTTIASVNDLMDRINVIVSEYLLANDVSKIAKAITPSLQGESCKHTEFGATLHGVSAALTS
jgi:hypothetical protein